jgi:hypothetical protein
VIPTRTLKMSLNSSFDAMNEADEPREANEAGSDRSRTGMSALNMDNSDNAFQNLHSLHSLFALFKKVDDRESLYSGGSPGLSEKSFHQIFGEALSNASDVQGSIDAVFSHLAKPDSSKIMRIQFADFASHLLQQDDTLAPLLTTRPKPLPPISDMSKMSLVHMKALSVEFNSNDDGKGLEMDQFVSVLSQVLPGLASEALEAQFMKVDANSDGFVL